ncbi:MarR family transcriptional regulator [bacterium]|nr:MarR family transcriptional regulator [bacterium]
MNDPMGDLHGRDDLLLSIAPLLIAAGTITTRGGNRFVFGPYRLTVHQFSILHHLSGCSCKMMDLKDIMFNSAANITQHVDALEERGWVRRVPSPQDRRVTLVEITPKGRDQLAAAEKHYVEQMRRFMRDFDDDQLTQVISFLSKYITHSVGVLERGDLMTDDPKAS